MWKRDLTASVILAPPLLPYVFYLCRYMLMWKNWFFHQNGCSCIFYFILYKMKYRLAKIRHLYLNTQWHKWYWKSEPPLTLDSDQSMPSITKTAAGWMQGVSTRGKAPAGRQNQTNLQLHSDRKQEPSPKTQSPAKPCQVLLFENSPYGPADVSMSEAGAGLCALHIFSFQKLKHLGVCQLP